MPAGRLRDDAQFRRFWLASTASDLGTYAGAIALIALIEDDLGGSATDLGLVSAARWAPYLVVGLLAGVLADRVRRRPLLVGTDAARALVLAAVPALALAGELTVPLLAGLMALFGLLSVCNDAAHQSFLPRLLPAGSLPRANMRLEQSTAVAQTTGPALGGGLVALLGAPFAFLLDALTYAASAVLIGRTSVADPPPAADRRRSVLAEVRDGARWVYGHPMLRPLAIGTHVWVAFHAVLMTAYGFFALRELDIGELGLGVTLAFAGIGALVGTTWSERLADRFGLCRAVAGSRVLEGAGYAVVIAAAAAPTPVAALGVACAGQLVYGLGMGAEGPTEMSYRQSVTPDRLQGRMNATMRSINRAAVVVGAPAGGLLADAVGLRTALWVGAAGVAGAGAGLAVSGFRHASRPR